MGHKLLSETIDELEARIKCIEDYLGVGGLEYIPYAISYGVVKRYKNWDLYFEAITDKKDGFVMRNKDNEIIGIFPESD